MPDLATLNKWIAPNLIPLAIAWVVLGIIQIVVSSAAQRIGSSYWSGYLLIAIGLFNVGLPMLLTPSGGAEKFPEIINILVIANAIIALMAAYGILVAFWFLLFPTRKPLPVDRHQS